MAKDTRSQEQVQEPLFSGLDLKKVHNVETVTEEKAEKYVFDTVDFSDPNRPPTCLEVDFPILRVNEISIIEGNATKPIYMMSKWWARRRSAIFRQLLIAAATKAPSNPEDTAQASWSLQYRKSHRKHGKFSKLHVADIFMGGGTTVVEAARMGFQVTAIDLNPIAWWVVKNETATVAPEDVQRFAQYIEDQVKREIAPFYTAKSPRGFDGHWVDEGTGKLATINPINVPPEQRKRFRWEGPEVVYTFWMKHIMCSDPYCCHLTPQVNSAVVAEKSLKVKVWSNCVCPGCGEAFDLEAAEFRMAPNAKFVIGEGVEPFAAVDLRTGKVTCPHCKKAIGAADVKAIQARKGKPVSREIAHYLLLSKDWLKGITAASKTQFGGYYGASGEQDSAWFQSRAEGLKLIEVRGSVPAELGHSSFSQKATDSEGKTASTGSLICGKCGRVQDPFSAIKASGHLAPVFPYLIQGVDPHPEAARLPYGGRYFDVPDFENMLKAFSEFKARHDLKEFVPSDAIEFGHLTHQRNDIIAHGYTHWYKMFNPRQLYVLGLLSKVISEAPSQIGSSAVKSQVFGGFQNYLRHNCMFTIWNLAGDKLEPQFANNHFNPKATTVENGVFSDLGRGNFASCVANVAEGMEFARSPYDLRLARADEKGKSAKVASNDTVISDKVQLYCASSTDLRAHIADASIDLVITDPPFGDNVIYSEMSDFFLVWLRKPLSQLFPEVFTSSASPKAQEAIANIAQAPGEDASGVRNADLMYDRLLTACWREAGRILRPGGLMAFTFHHDDDTAWIGVLDSLFRAGFIIECAFPVRSDEAKGDGDFGAKKIEYDIVHVCRKRLTEPREIFWATLRKQIIESVKSRATILAQHRMSGLHLADLEVIIRGEVLEQYSKYYGKVKKNIAGDLMGVREILLEANAISLSLLQRQQEDRIPDNVDAEIRALFTLMREGPAIERNAATKRLKGSGVTLEELEGNGWVEQVRKDGQRVVQLVHPGTRWNSLSRKSSLKSDLDQAHFAINCCMEGKIYKDKPVIFEDWLTENYKTVLPSVGAILKYMEATHFGFDSATKRVIGIAVRTLERTLQRLRDTDQEFRRASDQMDLFGGGNKGGE